MVLAGNLDSDILGEEVADGSVDQFIQTFLPFLRTIGLKKLVDCHQIHAWPTYMVVHESSALEEDARVIRELSLVDIGTVSSDMSTVINLISGRVKETDALNPVPGLLSPVGISLVTSVASKSGTQVEEASISNTFDKLVQNRAR